MTRRRVPVVTQLSQTECGLCCCLALLRHHGRAEDLAEARDLIDAGRDGSSARQLADFLTTRGMVVRSYRVRGVDALAGFDRPVILYWEEHHFLVLERFDGRTAVVMDPSVGRRRLDRAALEAGFSAIVIEAEPGPDFEPLRAAPLAEWRGLPLLADGARPRIALVAALSLGAYGAVLGVPLLTRWAVDRSVTWSAGLGLAHLVALVAAAAVGYLALHLLRVAVLSTLVALLSRHLTTELFRRLLALPYRFFSTRQPGELLFRLTSVTTVRDLLSSRFAQGALDLGTVGCITVYLFLTDWRIASLAAGALVLNAAYLAVTRRRVQEAVDAEIAHLSRSQAMQLDAIVSIPAIKMGGYADEFLDSWSEAYGDSLTAMRTRMRLQEGRTAGAAMTTQLFAPMVLLLVSLYLVGNGRMSLGDAVAVQAVSVTYFALASSVLATYTEFAEASRYLARIREITDAEPEPPGGGRTRLASTAIRLEDVSFRYNRHGRLVVREVSLEVEAGAKVALVGASGSGKSTLGRILCGLHEPTEGQVFVGGRPLADYDRTALRRAIGYVPQEVHLHNRSILENLTLGQDLPLETVRAYCDGVGILDFLEDLPMGLRTMVSEMGANFSGGQRQRIAIVRALLKRPRILLLDEATSSLDTVNERRVTRIIQELGTTQVVIAHRLATIRSADRIHVLREGRIVESGGHAELLARRSAYHHLYSERPSAPAESEPA